ncbi:MAG: thioredoxin domain-containing protein [Coriobacteriia bacterium]
MSRSARALLLSSVLVAIGLVIALMLVQGPVAENSTAVAVDAGDVPVREFDAQLGEGDDVVLVVFSDFECEGCGIIAGSFERLTDDFSGQVTIVHKHMPLSSHPRAMDAAAASEAAALQGRFWEMHDLLFAEQDTWRAADDHRALFSEYAEQLGLDVQRFERDMHSAEVAERVEADRRDGEELGVNLLPTVYINGSPVAGAMTYRMLHDAIDQVLNK